MAATEHTIISKLFALVIFGMAFLLTPRAWVEPVSPRAGAAMPVQILERDDCLWCAPVKPVDCDTTNGADGTQRLWLNPDEPPPKQEATPCITPPEERPQPSA